MVTIICLMIKEIFKYNSMVGLVTSSNLIQIFSFWDWLDIFLSINGQSLCHTFFLLSCLFLGCRFLFLFFYCSKTKLFGGSPFLLIMRLCLPFIYAKMFF